MFTATRVAAVVAIVALGGSLALVAGPLGPSADTAPVPGAATSSPSPSPGAIDDTYFTGVMTVGPGVEGTTEVGPDDVIRLRGGRYDAEWKSTDPRFTGVGGLTTNENSYKTGSGGVVDVGWGTMSVETEDGTWHSATPVVAGVVRRPIAAEIDTRIPVWFVGDGAYEGMTALLVYTIVPSTYPPFRWNYEGWIVPGDAHLTEMVE